MKIREITEAASKKSYEVTFFPKKEDAPAETVSVAANSEDEAKAYIAKRGRVASVKLAKREVTESPTTDAARASRPEKDTRASKADAEKAVAKAKKKGVDPSKITEAVSANSSKARGMAATLEADARTRNAARNKRLVRDRKTGELYDPEQKFDDLTNSPEFAAQMKRMANPKKINEAPSWAKEVRSYRKGEEGDPGYDAQQRAKAKYAASKAGKLDELRTEPFDEQAAFEAILNSGIGVGNPGHPTSFKTGIKDFYAKGKVYTAKMGVYTSISPEDDYGNTETVEEIIYYWVFRDYANPTKLDVHTA